MTPLGMRRNPMAKSGSAQLAGAKRLAARPPASAARCLSASSGRRINVDVPCDTTGPRSLGTVVIAWTGGGRSARR